METWKNKMKCKTAIRYALTSLNLIFVFSLTGCATTSSQPIEQTYISARQIEEKPSLIRIPHPNINTHLVYGNDPALEDAFHQYLKSGKAPDILTDGFIKFAYNSGQQPIIKTTPFQETVISLEPGERFTNISSGDPNRWSYAVAVSGVGPRQQQNILVKPSLPEIGTNMVITTDRRLYNIRLISSMNGGVSRNVSFWYPDEMVNVVNNVTLKEINNDVIATTPDVNLNNLNFDYCVACNGIFSHCPSWRPTRIFDDGVHTYIQFPASMANRDMPALFVLEGSQNQLVNYRSKPPYFVVDKIFREAVLIIGVGNHQTKVRIVNRHY